MIAPWGLIFLILAGAAFAGAAFWWTAPDPHRGRLIALGLLFVVCSRIFGGVH